MKKQFYLIIGIVFSVGLGLGFSVNVSGEESLIPSWIKSTAGFWVEGKIGDQEFIQALQYLVEKDILKIPPTEKDSVDSNIDTKNSEYKKYGEFSKTTCYRDSMGWVVMVGKYTNGSIPYESIYFDLIVLDSNGTVLAMGSGHVNDIGAFETKAFETEANFKEPFDHCEIQISNAFD